MAGELRIGGPAPGSTVYARITKSTNSQWWNGSSFEDYASANYGNYVVTMTEQGTSGIWVGNFPAGITDELDYEIFYHVAGDSGAAEGDAFLGTGTWNPGGSSSSSSGTVSGEVEASDWVSYVTRTFKRTDKTTEIYDATNEAIAEIRRKIRTAREEKETTSTDTIATLGDYRIDLEDDFGTFVSDVFIRDESDGRYLIPISKAMYDTLYGKWGSGSTERDWPKHYCVFGRQVLVGPVPDKTTYNYVLSYSKDDHVLVTAATTSVPFTTTDYREILKHGVLFRLYKLVENDDQAAAYQGMWKQGLEEIETKERRNRREIWAGTYRDV